MHGQNGTCHDSELKLEWQADAFASGIYFIKATSGSQTAVVKSILLK